ncbi:hypothetical protein TNIN_109271 [Trichonephila inaurata madagascariensis]|uniref:Uncharacterized protein n=1 Tax=Trichonephila inaurata madagascariensis TaxID=2747483 RepID=A0A8X7CA11_9ARAC|nr:hypothetical protein TNIN_60471 [Trichonephila inaurata madagascariensis]GFY74242.1 hypothetical protein TNIN_109271 [Trichonephila inaurata madagascariensis]
MLIVFKTPYVWKSIFCLLKRIIVSVEDGLSLGLMIRGGAEYGLGIYITGVDESSAADLAGLMVGSYSIS